MSIVQYTGQVKIQKFFTGEEEKREFRITALIRKRDVSNIACTVRTLHDDPPYIYGDSSEKNYCPVIQGLNFCLHPLPFIHILAYTNHPTMTKKILAICLPPMFYTARRGN